MSRLPVELELESAVVASAETVPVRFKLGEIGTVSPPIYVCVSSPEGVVRSKQMVEEGGTQILLETSDMPLGDYEVRLVSEILSKVVYGR